MTDNPADAPEDLGPPLSYLVLDDGTPVYDRSGTRVGSVQHVLADEGSDIFHGLVLDTPAGHRFARSDLVDGIYARGVIVSAAADRLPEPGEDAVARAVEAQDHSLAEGLRRAWNRLLGRETG
ncbi:MAG TPA: PRC-barrel domain-containing protein [Actinoplanes sp.]|nr:PRC-barrel domain-containing protein [Actinoplanes sp.]